jgi:16S rRNA C967 or C1407 C5-methylase (RsmB/RsmF family)
LENDDRVQEFLKANPDFRIDDARQAWDRAIGTERPEAVGESFRASPLGTDTDGFFVTRLRRAR